MAGLLDFGTMAKTLLGSGILATIGDVIPFSRRSIDQNLYGTEGARPYSGGANPVEPLTPTPGTAAWYSYIEGRPDLGTGIKPKDAEIAIDRFLKSDSGKYGSAFYIQRGGDPSGLRDWARNVLLLPKP